MNLVAQCNICLKTKVILDKGWCRACDDKPISLGDPDKWHILGAPDDTDFIWAPAPWVDNLFALGSDAGQASATQLALELEYQKCKEEIFSKHFRLSTYLSLSLNPCMNF